MKTKVLILFRLFTKIIPVSKFFCLKNMLLNMAGAYIDKTARIYSNVKVFGTGKLEIGCDSFVGHEVMILSSYPGAVLIGKNVDIAPRVYIGTGSHLIQPGENHVAGKGTNEDIIIHDGVWIGACSVILPGTVIGQKSIIGAGSVVNSEIPSFTIAVGVPCKPIKKWNSSTQKWEPFDLQK